MVALQRRVLAVLESPGSDAVLTPWHGCASALLEDTPECRTVGQRVGGRGRNKNRDVVVANGVAIDYT